MMASSPALVIVQGNGETLIGQEANRARFVYTDGRDHSDTKAPDYRPCRSPKICKHHMNPTIPSAECGT
jgi:hypothetical protein